MKKKKSLIGALLLVFAIFLAGGSMLWKHNYYDYYEYSRASTDLLFKGGRYSEAGDAYIAIIEKLQSENKVYDLFNRYFGQKELRERTARESLARSIYYGKLEEIQPEKLGEISLKELKEILAKQFKPGMEQSEEIYRMPPGESSLPAERMRRLDALGSISVQTGYTCIIIDREEGVEKAAQYFYRALSSYERAIDIYNSLPKNERIGLEDLSRQIIKNMNMPEKKANLSSGWSFIAILSRLIMSAIRRPGSVFIGHAIMNSLLNA